jgi:hypothetical protein
MSDLYKKSTDQRQKKTRIHVPDFKKKIDHIIETHPRFSFEKGKGGYGCIYNHVGIKEATFRYLLNGNKDKYNPYGPGELFTHQVEKLCNTIPIQRETLFAENFENSKNRGLMKLKKLQKFIKKKNL